MALAVSGKELRNRKNDYLRINFFLISECIVSVILGFLCISFLVSGVVFPTTSKDIHLLRTLNLEASFSIILAFLMVISLILSLFIYNRLINDLLENLEKEQPISHYATVFVLSPIWIPISVIVFYFLQAILKWLIFSDPFTTSTVISNIILYPLGGYAIGQTMAKIVKIVLWEQKSSKKIFWDKGKLISRG